MNITPIKKTDDDALTDLFRQTFTHSEGAEEGQLIGDLVSELIAETPEEDLYGFVAKDGGIILGAVFFSRMTFSQEINAFILSPMAVRTDHQGEGIGQKLISYGINKLKESGVKLLLTYGDPDYYSKTGFQQITEKEVPAPLTLSYPHGWLAQSLIGESLFPVKGPSKCVDALNKKVYW